MAQYPRVETDPQAEADLAAHEADTTNVHGIADTARLITIDNIAQYAPAPDLSTLVTVSPSSSARNVIQPVGDYKALVVKAAVGQTSNPFEVQDSGGVPKVIVNSAWSVKTSADIVAQNAGASIVQVGAQGPAFESGIKLVDATIYRGSSGEIILRSSAGVNRLQVGSDVNVLTGNVKIAGTLQLDQAAATVITAANGTATLSANATNPTTLVVKGTASQGSTDYFDVQDSGGTPKLKVSSLGDTYASGKLIVGTNSQSMSGLRAMVVGQQAGDVQLAVKSAVAQTADVFQVLAGDGTTVQAAISSTGAFSSPGANVTAVSGNAANKTTIGAVNSGSGVAMRNGAANIYSVADGVVTVAGGGTATASTLVVKSIASQTANLQEWQSSGGAAQAIVTSGGVIKADAFDGLTTNPKVNNALTIGTSARPSGLGGPALIINNVTTPPTASVAGGGVLYSDSGALKWYGPSGTITTLAVA